LIINSHIDNNFLKEIILSPKKQISLLIISQLICANALMVNVAHADDKKLDENTSGIVPEGISNAVSDMDMQVRLAAKSNAAPCFAENCIINQDFDVRVQQLGGHLSEAAYVVYPNLKKRVPSFVFSVVDKKDPGTASNGGGKVVLFRGLQQLELTDDALSFIIAREMGHVIGKHHNKNTSTKLVISALASILFPAVGIIGASSAATQATTATTLLTSAASTATSMLGSEVALAKMKPSQLIESDDIAINLLANQAWDIRSVASILHLDDDPEVKSTQNNWIQDLQVSSAHLQAVVDNEDLAVLPLDTESVSVAEEGAEPIDVEAAQ